MKLYKLTDQNNKTYGCCEWGKNVTHKARGNGGLCTDGIIHAYVDPLIAILMNPIHAKIDDPVVWEAEGEIVESDGLKVGCKELTTTKVIPTPSFTTEQRVAFAILRSLDVYSNTEYKKWATGWLCNKDRSVAAARDAARNAESAFIDTEESELAIVSIAHEVYDYFKE